MAGVDNLLLNLILRLCKRLAMHSLSDRVQAGYEVNFQ